MDIKDGDHVLVDGCGWFDSGDFTVRIFTVSDGKVVVMIYKIGEEIDAPISMCDSEGNQYA